MIDQDTFKECKGIKTVEFLEGRESLGTDGDLGIWNALFRDCGVAEVVLPRTLKRVHPAIFKDCGSLLVVRMKIGCAVDIRKLVDLRARVKRQ